MENQELKHYIDTQLAGGTSPDELKKLLMHHGWAPEIVDAHMPPTVPAAPPLAEADGIGAIDGGSYLDDQKKRKWAIFFLVLPFALLVLILIVFAVNALEAGSAAKIVNVALSLLGLLAFLSIFVCIPIGVVLLVRSRRTLKPGAAYDERSGKYEMSVIPPELGHWNWGAAFLTLWWGIYYRVWISFLIFVPVVGQFWWVVMGVKGNEWAWQKNKWLSVEEFKKAQRKWMPWAIALLVLSIMSGLAWASLIVITASRMGKVYGTVQQLNPADGLSGFNIVSGAPLGVEAMNATYNINDQPVTLKNGTSISHPFAPGGVTDVPVTATTNYFGKAAYGDLNGDGLDDMVFVMWQQTGGSGTFYYLAAALDAPNGAAPLTDTVLLGDRIKPVSTEINSGVIVVTYLARNPNEPMTAVPSVAVVRGFKIVNGKLEEIK